jgi:signal transduction histidine kinase
LASLKLNLDITHTLVSRDPGAAETLLLDLRSKSQSAIADIRRLVYDLRPPALDELGLIGAIQEYGRQIESMDGLSIQWDVSKPLPPLPAAVEVAAYRITMEALANIVRHSHGLNCQVSISMIDNSLQVEVCDDGLGLPDNVQPDYVSSAWRHK